MNSPQQQQRDENRIVAQEALVRINNLKANADFAWFMAQCVASQKHEQTLVALDPKRASEECDVARQRRDALEKVETWLTEAEATYRSVKKG
jgi:hypothetical protein